MSAGFDTLTPDVICDRLAMAMAEAGYPCVPVIMFEGQPNALGVREDEGALKAWHKALAVVGVPSRCWPCRVASDIAPRVSPDCEGTGRCAP